MTRTGVIPPYAAEPPGVRSSKPFRRLRLALSLSGLGHWLSVPDDPGDREERGPLAPRYLEVLVDWLRERLRPRAP